MIKGDCYKVAFDLMVDNKGFLLVHGLVKGQGDLAGTVIGHAWCEFQDCVFDYSNGHQLVTRKENYYAKGVVKVKRYTYEQALKLGFKHENYGSWDDEVCCPHQRGKK